MEDSSDRGARPEAAAVCWLSKRNCSLAPRQVVACYLPLCAVTAAVGVACWRIGAAWVLAFAALEIAALATALLAYARHAADRETVEIHGSRLVVRHCHGERVTEVEFAPAWVLVKRPDADCALVEVSGHGRRALIGRYIRPEKRPRLADELRRALKEQMR